MPITLGTNIASLSAQRRLAEGTSQLSKTFERLSSGLRINSAADDSAGLAIAESLKADRRVFNQGIRNLNDGISLLNIADSAIEQLSSIVVRLAELAEQSANGTFGKTQREALDAEAQALSDEYLRIAQSTEFNGRGLFSAGFGSLSLQAGYGNQSVIQSNLGGAIGTGNLTNAGSQTINISYTSSLASADVNGDGIADIVNLGHTVSALQAVVQIGNGNGSFAQTVSYSLVSGANPSDEVQLADINNDGNLDIVAVSSSGGNAVALTMLGNGDGTFAPVVSYQQLGTNSTSLQLADLNGDGHLDLVTNGAPGTVSTIAVRLGSASGTFGALVSTATSSTGLRTLRLGDLNEDGFEDLVMTRTGGGVEVRLGLGDGSFAGATNFTSANTFVDITLGDINGDGHLDMLGTSSAIGGSQISLRLGQGNGTFGAETTYSGNDSVAYSLKVGDLNGDGYGDVIAGGHTQSYQAEIVVRLGQSNGTFGAAQSFTTTAFDVRGLALGDYNGDGVLDIAGGGDFDALGGQTIFLGQTEYGIGALLEFKLTTIADSRAALSQFQSKLQHLGAQRGQVGAFQARVEVGVSNLLSATENYAAAESRIRDADIAADSAELARLTILQQAATAVLAQANLQPQIALQLLQSDT